MCGGQRWKNYWSPLKRFGCTRREEGSPCVLLQRVSITLTVEAIMYCAYPVPGMGSNSLMYYYNGKSVSTLSGDARAGRRSAGGGVCPRARHSVRLRLLVHLSVPSVRVCVRVCPCSTLIGSPRCVCLNYSPSSLVFLHFSTAAFKCARQ